MDRNAITGIVLITVLTLVYFTFFAPNPEDLQPDKPKTEQVEASTQEDRTDASDTAPAVIEAGMSEDAKDSVEVVRRMRKYSDFYLATQGEEKDVTVTTEKLTVNLNTLGGAISSAYLNEYRTYDSLPLPVIQNHPGNEMYFQFFFDGAEGKTIKSSDLFFQLKAENGMNVSGSDSIVVRMVAAIDDGKYIEQSYTFFGDRYDVGYDVRFVGLEDRLGKYSSYEYNWTSYLPKTELSIKNMRQKTTIAYKQGEDVDKMGEAAEQEKEDIKTPVDWVLSLIHI